jgi:hypothetical protein
VADVDERDENNQTNEKEDNKYAEFLYNMYFDASEIE